MGLSTGHNEPRQKLQIVTFQSLVSWYRLQDLSPVTGHTKTLREFLQAASLFPGPLVANTRRRLRSLSTPSTFDIRGQPDRKLVKRSCRRKIAMQRQYHLIDFQFVGRWQKIKHAVENDTSFLVPRDQPLIRRSWRPPIPAAHATRASPGPSHPPFPFTSHLMPSQKSAAQSESSCPVNVTLHSSGTRYY